MAPRKDNVRALVRGLSILRHVNSVGSARAAEIAKALDIPRPTVYRLLQTLEEEGYVLFSATDARVRISPMASGLSDNSAARSRLCHAAAPHLNGFTDEYKWPVDLAVYSDARMVVEETTHWRSPLSVDSNMAGFSLPMLRSSAGRAYLAFCDPREKAIILQLLALEGDSENEDFLGDWVNNTLPLYKSQGFATRGPHIFRPQTSSLSVPIIFDGRVIACVSVIWIAKAVSMQKAIKQYVEPLQTLANTIAKDLAEPSKKDA